MDRRSFIAGAPAIAILPVGVAMASTSETTMAALVEAVMCGITPSRCAGYSIVTTADLQALCEATGVRWREHWANRLEKSNADL